MTIPEYPKWVQRSPEIGAVLCKNKAEEDKLLADYDASLKAQEKEADEELPKLEIQTRQQEQHKRK